jgi:hypothetical protein
MPESSGPYGALGLWAQCNELEHPLGQPDPARYGKRTALADGECRENERRGQDRLRQLLGELTRLPFPPPPPAAAPAQSTGH